MDKNTIIWTRSADDFQDDQRLFGHWRPYVLHLPCIRSQGLETALISQSLKVFTFNDPFAAYEKVVILTSWRAAHYALAHPELAKLMAQARLFCFGAKTKAFLEERSCVVACLENVHNASEIPQALRKFLRPEKTFILLPGPKLRAYPLEAALRRDGYTTLAIDIYETIPLLRRGDSSVPNESEKQELIQTLTGFVFFASPSACQGFVDFFCPQNNRLSEVLVAFSLGQTTGEYCRKYFSRICVAKQQDIKSAFAEITTLFAQNIKNPL